MPYGTIKVDNIVFTNSGVDQTIGVSGLVQSVSGNLTATGTISGNLIRGTTVSGATITGQVLTVTSGIFSSGTASAPSIGFTGDGNTGFWTPAGDAVALSTGGSERLRVDSDGDLGVGTTDPTSRLTVRADAASGPNTIIRVENRAASAGATTQNIKIEGIFDYNNGTSDASAGAIVFGKEGTYTTATTNNDSYLALETVLNNTSTERARIDSSGRLLVGTSTAQSGTRSQYSKFTVQGNNQSTSDGGQVNLANNTNPASLNTGDTLGQIIFTDNGAGEYGKIACQMDGAAASSGDYPGRLVFSTTADGAASPTERMRLDSSGRLGLGTSSPGYPLTVSSGIAASLTVAAIENSANIDSANFTTFKNELVFVGDKQNRYSGSGAVLGPLASISTVYANTTFGADSDQGAGALAFSTRARTATTSSDTLTERLRIDDQGRVGIGTTSPAGLIHGRTAVGAVGLLLEGNTGDSNTSPPVIDFRGSVGSGQGARIAAINTGAGFGRLDLAFYTSDTGSDTYTPAERMRIDRTGRLLVGTSTATKTDATVTGLVQVQSSANERGVSLLHTANDASATILQLSKIRSTSVVQSGDFLGRIQFNGYDGGNYKSAATIDALVDGTPGANDMPGRLVFSTTADGASSPTERMRIGSNGIVSIGSSLPGIAVVGIDNSSNTSGTQVLGLLNRANANNTSSYYLVCQEPNVANRCFIYGNGNLANANNSYGAISDIKLKENISDATSQWGDLKALQVRNYNFKEETGQQTHRQIGLIAQEVEQISPGLVYESPDRDVEGNDLGTVTKSVNYSVLYMKAVKALQEAMERIETLEAKVAALEAV